MALFQNSFHVCKWRLLCGILSPSCFNYRPNSLIEVFYNCAYGAITSGSTISGRLCCMSLFMVWAWSRRGFHGLAPMDPCYLDHWISRMVRRDVDTAKRGLDVEVLLKILRDTRKRMGSQCIPRDLRDLYEYQYLFIVYTLDCRIY